MHIDIRKTTWESLRRIKEDDGLNSLDMVIWKLLGRCKKQVVFSGPRSGSVKEKMTPISSHDANFDKDMKRLQDMGKSFDEEKRMNLEIKRLDNDKTILFLENQVADLKEQLRFKNSKVIVVE